jgi:hypothetical protein
LKEVRVSAQVHVALIAAGGSLLVALAGAGFSYVTKRRSDVELARLQDALDEARAERDAQRDYTYEARKRLYAELQPLLFQLVELCESAYNRMLGLALAARQGHLGLGKGSWLAHGYYSLSTVHRFLAPLAAFRLCQRRLTLVDLSVDPEVRTLYLMAKQLYVTWNASFDLASAEPKIPYDPDNKNAWQLAHTDPACYARQHVVMGQLDQAIDGVTVGAEDARRVMTYGEFEQAYSDKKSPVRSSAAIVRDLFDGFHPDERPVLWRILLAEAHIYRALVRTFDPDSPETVRPPEAISVEERKKFDWRLPGSTVSFEDAVETPFRAVRRYLQTQFSSTPT